MQFTDAWNFDVRLGLVGVYLVALFIAALLRRPRWVNGVALASLLVFLIGLGSCGYMFTNP
jgi:cytochrome c oxidase assembly factor CtaG